MRFKMSACIVCFITSAKFFELDARRWESRISNLFLGLELSTGRSFFWAQIDRWKWAEWLEDTARRVEKRQLEGTISESSICILWPSFPNWYWQFIEIDKLLERSKCYPLINRNIFSRSMTWKRYIYFCPNIFVHRQSKNLMFHNCCTAILIVERMTELCL